MSEQVAVAEQAPTLSALYEAAIIAQDWATVRRLGDALREARAGVRLARGGGERAMGRWSVEAGVVEAGVEVDGG
jgi:hypothetical protein